jgi:lipopolysaccharide export system protein LptA
VGAGLLVLVIAAFLGYARYRVRKVISELPGKMGATITREANGITFSKSDGKRTIFTIHAAKEMQHSDGKLALRDVSMILYGNSGDRADRISGDDFEYDTKAQVVKALGVVHLDLGSEATGAPDSEARKHYAGPASEHDDVSQGRVIHVKTSNLVYTKQSGVATTDQGLEFAFGGYTGKAVGAVYDSTTGHVVLQSAVTVSGLDKGRPVALAASHGELDRATRLAEFKDARYSSAGQVAKANLARLHLRPDNSIEQIDCLQEVVLEDGEHGRVTSDRAVISLDAANKPQAAVLTGNVIFNQDEAQRQARGESDRAELSFKQSGNLEHVLMRGRVKAKERLGRSGDGKSSVAERTLESEALDIRLATVGTESRSQVRDVKATGSVQMATSAVGIAERRFFGDIMTAHMVPVNGSPELSAVHGDGHTAIEQKGGDGVFQRSTGDTLDAKFRPSEKSPGKNSAELESAVQQGNVAIERSVPSKSAGGPVDLQHATAKQAAYDAASDRLTLTGDVVMKDAGRQVLAARVTVQQGTGDATADGGVRVTYQQPGSEEPVHILAARAEFSHGSDKAIFFGRGPSDAALARLWQAGLGGQGGSQIEAPVLIFEGLSGQQKDGHLTARAETQGTPGQIHAVLAEKSQGKTVGSLGDAKSRGLARIVSSELVYSDTDRRAHFTGGVRLVDGTGEVKAEDAVVFLTPRDAAAKSERFEGEDPKAMAKTSDSGGLFAGSVERVVAIRRVEMTQPGRKATGERLVYTASDQMFVLTGTAAAPPRVVDALQGSTTGASLKFHTGDNSVVVSGADGEAPSRKVETETRVKRK